MWNIMICCLVTWIWTIIVDFSCWVIDLHDWFFILGNWFEWVLLFGNLFMNACKVFEKMSKCIWMNVLMLKCIVFCFCYALIKVWKCLNACKVFEKMSKCVRMNVLVLECIDFLFDYVLFRVWMNIWLIWLNNLVCLLVVGRWCMIGGHQ